jgi:hypothetical protein
MAETPDVDRQAQTFTIDEIAAMAQGMLRGLLTRIDLVIDGLTRQRMTTLAALTPRVFDMPGTPDVWRRRNPTNTSAEQQARDLLERMGVEDAQAFSAGDLGELANLIADRTDPRRSPTSETPGFDQIAARIVTLRADLEGEEMTQMIAEQLRLMWNARGAVDLAKIDAVLSMTVAAPYVKTMNAEIRKLDR